MMRKILAAFLALCFAATLASCTKNVENNEIENENEIKTETEASASDVNLQEEKPKIVLDIKPLEEVDETVLASAAAKLGFENTALFHAFANAIGKRPEEVTQQDVDAVHYISVGPEANGSNALYIGHINYIDLCLSEGATAENIIEQLNEVVMMSELDLTDTNLGDLKNFRNVEMFEIYEVAIDDVSFVNNYNSLIFGYFKNNGITDVSSLKDYNPESLFELDFTGNDISDWSPLEHIKEKVIYFYDLQSGVAITLESYLEQKANNTNSEISAEPEKEAIADNGDTENVAANENKGLVDQNGNPVDFSSLFE